MATIVYAVSGPGTGLAGLVVAKGDILVAAGPGLLERLPAGTASQVLSVDPTTSTGLRWTGPPSIPSGLGLGPLGTSPLGS